MVKIGRKDKVLCGGKLILTNFKKLDPGFFNHVEDEQMDFFAKAGIVFTPDGKIYVDSHDKGIVSFVTIFEILMGEKKETLEEFQKIYSEKFPDIKDFDDLTARKWEDEEKNDQAKALFMLSIPIELRRRELEMSYYGKMRKFPS